MNDFDKPMNREDAEKIRRAHDVAGLTALHAILRRMIAEILPNDDPAEFRKQVELLERAVIADLEKWDFKQASNEATDLYVRESASGFVSRFFSGMKPRQK